MVLVSWAPPRLLVLLQQALAALEAQALRRPGAMLESGRRRGSGMALEGPGQVHGGLEVLGFP
jgi:hypothetical protein